jgi:hypothetical protein
MIKEDIHALKKKVEIEQEKLRILPTALEPSAPQSNKSVDDIMAPLSPSTKDSKDRIE